MNNIQNLNILSIAQQRLKTISPNALFEAELLLAHVQNITREQLLARLKDWFPKRKFSYFLTLLNKRIAHVPLAYIIGRKAFYDLEFIVTPDVLIPRPESELIIEQTLNIVSPNKPCRILDVGTGSGCLAITIAKHLPQSSITALDISSKALKVAYRNASRHKVVNKIYFLKSNLLEKVKGRNVDLIIANLPYLPTPFTSSLQDEPKIALAGGGKYGLQIYKRFIKELAHIKTQHLLIEIDPRQAKQLLLYIKSKLSYVSLKLHKDLAGLDRVIEIEFTKW